MISERDAVCQLHDDKERQYNQVIKALKDRVCSFSLICKLCLILPLMMWHGLWQFAEVGLEFLFYRTWTRTWTSITGLILALRELYVTEPW